MSGFQPERDGAIRRPVEDGAEPFQLGDRGGSFPNDILDRMAITEIIACRERVGDMQRRIAVDPLY